MAEDVEGAFRELVNLLERLRAPNGCPWDREQTHASLKRNFLEETYEVLEAIDHGDPARLTEELGDMLLQILFHSQIGREEGSFTIEDVLRSVRDKLIRRHPHVFGHAHAADARQVEANWHLLKRAEGGEGSLLRHVPRELPALAYSQLVQERASHAGFDWAGLDGVLDKLVEELAELEGASSPEEREREFGDLVFTVVNAGRKLGLHGEEALRQANARFVARFTTMERLCRERGLSFPDLPLEEKERLWQEAKAAERG